MLLVVWEAVSVYRIVALLFTVKQTADTLINMLILTWHRINWFLNIAWLTSRLSGQLEAMAD